MKKYRLQIIIFLVNAVYMILELIASRILSPYFGSSNVVWTSVIGIILLSSSVGNYIGGIIADKNNTKKNVKTILLIAGIVILLILLLQNPLLKFISSSISSIKIGAIISTIFLFFIPSMIIGFLSPIMIKLLLEDLSDAGKTSGRIYAIGTLGGIAGTFLGGFYLLPVLGSKTTLFLLAIIMFTLIFLVEDYQKKWINYIMIISLIVVGISGTVIFRNANKVKSKLVKKGESGITVEYDTQYGKVDIVNMYYNTEPVRLFQIDKGYETVVYLDENKKNDLFSQYTKCYDLMFKFSNNINDTLMIGGAGYAYPRYYISKYQNKNIDVVEIDNRVTELAKEYFYLDDLIKEYNLEDNNRLGLITEDGRTYLNKTEKKYDAILNDAFSGSSPAENLTTLEAVQKIYNSLNKDGVYLTNIISSLEGKDSKFLKAEVNTIQQVFKNVYVVPVSTRDESTVQNLMVIASDTLANIENSFEITMKDDEIVITDDCCPVDNLIPII